jgi:cytochrome P450
MWFAGANRDPRRFPEPNTLQLDRPNANEHVTFSAGHHRCLGSPLAKIELAELLTLVPERLRDFQIKRDEVETYPLAGAVSGWVRVPVTFTSGTPSTAGTCE